MIRKEADRLFHEYARYMFGHYGVKEPMESREISELFQGMVQTSSIEKTLFGFTSGKFLSIMRKWDAAHNAFLPQLETIGDWEGAFIDSVTKSYIYPNCFYSILVLLSKWENEGARIIAVSLVRDIPSTEPVH